MIVYSGRRVYPHDSPIEGNTFPDLYSIGVSLGRMPRFAGHTKQLYSVLGHSLTVAAIMPDAYALFGLLHDAPEICCADVPTPWKSDSAKSNELELYERICQGHGLVWPLPEKVQALVDEADAAALAAEAHVLGHAEASHWWPSFDDQVAEITDFHLGHILQMQQPEVAGPLYEEAFAHYASMLDESCIADKSVLSQYLLDDE